MRKPEPTKNSWSVPASTGQSDRITAELKTLQLKMVFLYYDIDVIERKYTFETERICRTCEEVAGCFTC